MNGVSQSLSISLANALLSMLSPLSSTAAPGEVQQENRLVHHQWLGLWQLSLKLMSGLLDSLGHQFIAHALDFTGVNQERLVKVKNKLRILLHKTLNFVIDNFLVILAVHLLMIIKA